LLVSLALPKSVGRYRKVAYHTLHQRRHINTHIITRMTTIGMLIFLGTAFLTLAGIGAAPAKYDQRQEGEFNVHAKFENLLFVVSFPYSNEDVYTALQTVAELAPELKSRSNSPKDQESIKSDEEIRSEEPYSVEIVRIDENPSSGGSSARRAEGENAVKVSIGNKGVEKARSAKNMKAFQFPKSREVPTIVGYLLDPRKMHGYKTEDGGRARNVLGIIWSPDVELTKPGTSLKKQLLQKEKEEDVASNADRNDVASLSEEKQELTLLGDGIENCGPERRRDASGICQFDESAGFPS